MNLKDYLPRDNTDTELVHRIFIVDMAQLAANFCEDLKAAVMDERAEDSMWIRQTVKDLVIDFHGRAKQICIDGGLNYNEALAARQKQREQEGGQA